jgi:lactate permease
MTLLPFLAAIPILIMIILLVVLLWPSTKVMPIAWIVSLLIGYFVWHMSPAYLVASSIKGIEGALEIIIIVFGALLLLYTLEESGGLATINAGFTHLTTDKRIQAILVGFVFVSLLEGSAGFGVPAAICAPLLIALGFPPLAAVVIALIGNMPTVTFGAVGIPITKGYGKTLNIPQVLSSLEGSFSQFLQSVTFWGVTIHSLIGVFIPLLLILVLTKYFGKNRSWKEGFGAWKFAIFAGISFFIPYWVIGVLLGPELPALVASLLAFFILTYAIRKKFCLPKEEWKFEGSEKWPSSWKGSLKPALSGKIKISSLMAWLPYGLIALILVITRIQPFSTLLQAEAVTITWENIFETEITTSISPLFIPGIIPFILVAVVTFWLHKMNRGEIKRAISKAGKRIISPAIVLISSVAMAEVLICSSYNPLGYESMLVVMAKSIAGIIGRFWGFISPFIGAFGAFISGSNTVSNMIFGLFQWSAAGEVGISKSITLSLQAVGGSLGVGICIAKVVAACTTAGIVGKEGRVIRVTFIPTLIYATAVGIIGLLFTLVFFKGLF